MRSQLPLGLQFGSVSAVNVTGSIAVCPSEPRLLLLEPGPTLWGGGAGRESAVPGLEKSRVLDGACQPGGLRDPWGPYVLLDTSISYVSWV